MHFDRLDESYAMGKSNLNFGKVTLTDLTGLCILVRPVCTALPILVVNDILFLSMLIKCSVLFIAVPI